MYQGFKDILKLAQKIDNAEIHQKLLEVGEFAISLQEENQNLKERIQALESIEKIKENIIVEDGLYYIQENGIKKGPYCTRCWDVNKKLVLLKNTNIENTRFECPEDKNVYLTEQFYIEEERIRQEMSRNLFF